MLYIKDKYYTKYNHLQKNEALKEAIEVLKGKIAADVLDHS